MSMLWYHVYIGLNELLENDYFIVFLLIISSEKFKYMYIYAYALEYRLIHICLFVNIKLSNI